MQNISTYIENSVNYKELKSEVVSFLKRNSPTGNGYCTPDYEHFADLFIRLHLKFNLPLKNIPNEQKTKL
jgi:hypothetical protein